jgi:glycosyltransferase involved in cell wall biosynthesis
VLRNQSSTAVLPGEWELCWVGPRGWWAPERWLSGLSRRARRHGARRVRLAGMVSDEELCQLYRQATFCIYPSLYEGFGFPVLDALLHGTPVLSSLNSSLQEFAGPGVFYFDPCEAATLDAACAALLEGLPLAFERDDLRRRCCWDSLARRVAGLCV